MTTLSDWSFKTEEISAGMYKVRGLDTFGRRVESTGTDPDKLLTECRLLAAQIVSDIKRKKQKD